MSRSMHWPDRLRGAGVVRRCLQVLHALLGVADYGAYLRHMRLKHPHRIPQARTEFFRERQVARYARGRSRCC